MYIPPIQIYHPPPIAPSSHSSATLNLASQSDSYPQILLDKHCLIGYQNNSTSATLDAGKGLVVQVSFKTGDPPSLSQCFVRSYDLTGSRLAREPDILATSENLVLLRIHFTGNSIHSSYFAHYVYRAGPGIPSIHHVPDPCSDCVYTMAAILPLPDDNEHFAVVFPIVEYFRLESRKHYTLNIYRSDTRIWCTKVALFAQDEETHTAEIKLLFHNTTSVVYAGAGIIGWVDLWLGVMLCNVLDEKPTIRFVTLPVPDLWETPCEFRSQFEDLDVRPERHIAVYNGVIKFIELSFHMDDTICRKKKLVDQGWMATIWERSLSSDIWQEGITVDTSTISAIESNLMHVWPEILDDKKKLTWQKVVSGGPTLSMLDDMIYIMARVDLCDPTAFILAVNTRNSTLESCAQCSAVKMYRLSPSYLLCGLSSYFKTTADLSKESESKAIIPSSPLEPETHKSRSEY